MENQPLSDELTRPLLSELAVDAYRAALRIGVFDDAEIAAELGMSPARVVEARKTLQELRLLSPDDHDSPVVPLDPAVVEAELVTPLETVIASQRRRIAGIHRQLHSLVGPYRTAERSRSADVPIRLLDNADDVRREIDLARRRCTTERMSLQPGGGRSADLLQQDLVQTTELLRRGVRIRTLYQHTARSSLTTRTYVGHISEEGAEVRTAEELSERLIIYDRTIAFVPTERRGDEPPGAAVVTDPTLVAYLCRSFEAAWQTGSPFGSGTEPTDDQQVSADLRASILRLMSLGLKDEVIARRLGMATRTCRRHISALMDELGAMSRFQAGVIIGRRQAAPEARRGTGPAAGTGTAEAAPGSAVQK
ncbi:LuxR C-terminal-related transcriptional regulator [Streptomyces sp. NPDC059894]|uniref:LuxR C-terminal-related transcriptional regulator n=1 Tax=unclassified Streptomyces TaxID=2593676 RepID=UPI003655B2D4